MLQTLQEHPFLREMNLESLKQIYLSADLASDIRIPAVDFRFMEEYDVRKDFYQKYSHIRPVLTMPIYYLPTLNTEKQTLAVVSWSTMIPVDGELQSMNDVATMFLYKGYLIPSAMDAALIYALLNHLDIPTVLQSPGTYFSDMTDTRAEDGAVTLMPSKQYFKDVVEKRCSEEEQLQFIMATDLTFQGMCIRGLRFL